MRIAKCPSCSGRMIKASNKVCTRCRTSVNDLLIANARLKDSNDKIITLKQIKGKNKMEVVDANEKLVKELKDVKD